jgi:hypothetical protein
MLVAVLVIAPLSSTPWFVVSLGLAFVLCAALFAVAVEARATGWGTGSVVWLMVMTMVLTSVVAAAYGGWLVP